MAGPNDVELQLQLKGVDPGEAQRLAQMSSRALEDELRASLRIQQDLIARAATTHSDLEKRSAQESISQAKSNTRAIQDAYQLQTRAASQADAEIQKMGRAQSAAMVENLARQNAAVEGHSSALRNHIQVIHDVTETAFYWFSAIKGGYDQLKQFGEEVVRTTQIMQSQHVSIDAAKKAIDGTASSLELITAANRATQLGLVLTGDQFADVARQAKIFSDSTGTSSVEALEKLINGLAEGRKKTLDLAGVKINATVAEKEFADSVGVSTDRLNDTGKALAVQEYALRSLAQKSEEAKNKLQDVSDVSHELEKHFASSKDRWDELVFAIGNTKIDGALLSTFDTVSRALADFLAQAYHGMVVDLPHYVRLGIAEFNDIPAKVAAMFGVQVKGQSHVDQENSRDQYRADAAYGAQLKRQYDAQDADPFDENPKGPAARPPLATLLTNKSKSGGSSTVNEDREYTGMDRLWAGIELAERNRKQQERYAASDEASAKVREDQFNRANAGGVVTLAQQEQIKKQYEEIGRTMVSDEHGNQKLSGPGLLEKLFFGESGAPDELYEKMDDVQKQTFDVTKSMEDMLSQFGKGTAGAVGASLALALGEGKNLKAALAEQTHALLMNLSTQAFTQSGLYAAKGLAYLADGNVESSGLAFAASAGFAAVGFGAGIGARATQSGGGGGSSAASTPTATRASAPISSGVNNGLATPGAANITIIVNPAPGGEAEAGRSMLKALVALKAQTGQDIAKLLSTA
jgi:hypothetical protein